MAVRPIDGNKLIEWFRPYLHTGEAIPADVVIEDIRSMPTLTPPNEPLPVLVNDEPDREYIDYICPRCKEIIRRRTDMDYERLAYCCRERSKREMEDATQITLEEAATALSTLQAENKRLNKIVCSIPTTPDSGRTVSQYDKEMSMCAYLDDLEAENEKLRAELERVKAALRREQEAET